MFIFFYLFNSLGHIRLILNFHRTNIYPYLVIDYFHFFDGFGHDLTELVEFDLLFGDLRLNSRNLRRVYVHLLRQVFHVVTGRRDPSVQLDDFLLLFRQFVTDDFQAVQEYYNRRL